MMVSGNKKIANHHRVSHRPYPVKHLPQSRVFGIRIPAGQPGRADRKDILETLLVLGGLLSIGLGLAIGLGS